MVNDKRFITFIGGPGSGKTTIARHIALRMQKEGAEIVPVSGPDDVVLYGKSSIKQVFIIDDVIGVVGVEKIIRHKENLLHSIGNESRLFFTCRRTVYKEALKFKSFITENIFDLQNSDLAFSEDEKMKILTQHCSKAGIDSSVYKHLSLKSAEIMFPLSCMLFAKNKTYHKLGSRFFNTPYECLIDEIELLQETNAAQYAAMVLCLVNGNKISSQNLPDKNVKKDIYNCCGIDKGTSDKKIFDALKQMTGTFVSEVNNEYTFIHDSVYEIVAFHFGKDYVEQILKYMPTTFVANKVIVFGESPFEDLKIKIHENSFSFLADRMYQDILSMNLYEVFMNSSLKDQNFVDVFLNILKLKPYDDFKKMFLHRRLFSPDDIIRTETNTSKHQAWTDELIYNKSVREDLLMDKLESVHQEAERCEYHYRGISWVIYNGLTQLLCGIVSYVESKNEHFHLIFGSDSIEQTRLLILGCLSGNEDTVGLILKYIDKKCVNEVAMNESDAGLSYICSLNFHRKLRPLTASCHFGHTKIVEALIKHGADVNGKDQNFQTPLKEAILQGHYDVAKCLKQHNVFEWICFPEFSQPNLIHASYVAKTLNKTDIASLFRD